jgi:hypothetical protein
MQEDSGGPVSGIRDAPGDDQAPSASLNRLPKGHYRLHADPP